MKNSIYRERSASRQGEEALTHGGQTPQLCENFYVAQVGFDTWKANRSAAG